MGPHDTALEREHFGRSDDQTVPHRRSKMPPAYQHCLLSMHCAEQGLCNGSGVRLYVCLSVPSFARYTPLLRVCHCVPGGRKYRSIAARPALSSSGATAAVISSKCEQCYVYSWRRKLNIDVPAHLWLSSNVHWKLTFISRVFINTVFITFSPCTVNNAKCPWSIFFIYDTLGLILTILHYITLHYITFALTSMRFKHYEGWTIRSSLPSFSLFCFCLLSLSLPRKSSYSPDFWCGWIPNHIITGFSWDLDPIRSEVGSQVKSGYIQILDMKYLSLTNRKKV